MEWIVLAAVAVFIGGLALVFREVAAHNPK